MKGYVIEAGYMGYVDGAYMLFADEEDYQEYYPSSTIVTPASPSPNSAR